VEDDQDPAVAVVQRLQQRYPAVECRLYIGGKQGVVNPMVYNMAPAYDAAKYDIVWISTSRIKGLDIVSYSAESRDITEVTQCQSDSNYMIQNCA